MSDDERGWKLAVAVAALVAVAVVGLSGVMVSAPPQLSVAPSPSTSQAREVETGLAVIQPELWYAEVWQPLRPAPPPPPPAAAPPPPLQATLLGVSGTEGQHVALIELPRTGIQQARVGDTVQGWLVTEVETKSMTFQHAARDDHTQVLELNP